MNARSGRREISLPRVDVLKDYINFFLECVRSRIFEYMEMQFISNFYT